MDRNLHNQPLPKSILTIPRQAIIVLSMAVIVALFITIFRPFNIYESLDFLIEQNRISINSSEDAFFLALATVVVLGTIMVFCSRVILVKSRLFNPTYRGFIIWCLIEFVIVALGITIWSSALFHPEYTYTSLFRLFIDVLGRTACILSIPYLFCWLYIIIVDKASQLKALRESIDNDQLARLKAYTLIYDEHNEMRLSIRREDLILIESADNYICVWYMNNGQIKKSMIRNTMKRVAEQMRDSNVLRCHRSYMINMDRVKILRRDKEGVFIEFGIDGIADIPISRTYIDNITKWLMK